MSKYCTYCGTQLPDEALFCSNCGRKVNGKSLSNITCRDTENVNKPRTAINVNCNSDLYERQSFSVSKKPKRIFLACGVIGIVVILLCIILVSLSGEKQADQTETKTTDSVSQSSNFSVSEEENENVDKNPSNTFADDPYSHIPEISGKNDYLGLSIDQLKAKFGYDLSGPDDSYRNIMVDSFNIKSTLIELECYYNLTSSEWFGVLNDEVVVHGFSTPGFVYVRDALDAESILTEPVSYMVKAYDSGNYIAAYLWKIENGYYSVYATPMQNTEYYNAPMVAISVVSNPELLDYLSHVQLDIHEWGKTISKEDNEQTNLLTSNEGHDISNSEDVIIAGTWKCIGYVDEIDYYDKYDQDPDLTTELKYEPIEWDPSYYVINDNGQYYFQIYGFGGYGTYDVSEGKNGTLIFDEQFGPVFHDSNIMYAKNENMLINVYQKISEDTNPKNLPSFSLASNNIPFTAIEIYPVAHDKEESYKTKIQGVDYIQLRFAGEDHVNIAYETWDGEKLYSMSLRSNDLKKAWPTEIYACNQSETLKMYLTFESPMCCRAEIYGLPEGDVVMYFGPLAG